MVFDLVTRTSPDDTCLTGLISNLSDCYFSEVNRIFNHCTVIDLLLSTGKDMLFSIKQDKASSSSLELNVFRKASQRMFIVKNLYLSTKPLARILLKSFVASLIMHCLQVRYAAVSRNTYRIFLKIPPC